MYSIFKTDENNQLIPLQKPQPGCWISVVKPTTEEILTLRDEYGVLPEFLRAAMDPEETSHIDDDEDRKQTLIIVDYCIEKDSDIPGLPACITRPLSVIFQEDRLITISIDPNPFIDDLEAGKIKNIHTGKPASFLLWLMYAFSQKYQLYLRQIEAVSEKASDRLYRNMNNRGLLEMMELDKSLIYFSASLKTDSNTLEKLQFGRILPLSDEEQELLDDVIIEYAQASDMCTIYTTINERVSNGCNSVLSNNMNDIMKTLTVITIVMSIPNMIYGFYGMNVTGLPIPEMWFPLLLSVILCILCWIYFKFSSRFK